MNKIKKYASKFFDKSKNDANANNDELLELIYERENAKPTPTLPIEDPSLKETVFSPNQHAYLLDAEQFA